MWQNAFTILETFLSFVIFIFDQFYLHISQKFVGHESSAVIHFDQFYLHISQKVVGHKSSDTADLMNRQKDKWSTSLPDLAQLYLPTMYLIPCFDIYLDLHYKTPYWPPLCIIQTCLMSTNFWGNKMSL